MRTVLGCLLAAVVIASLTACDKADLPAVPSVDSIKQAVNNQVETVKQTVDAAGNVQFELDSPVSTAGCYGRLIAAGGGRPAVFTLASYNAASNEAFPSFFLQAQTKATAATQLAGAPIEAVVFVQQAKDGPAWHSPDDRPAQVTVSALEGEALSGQVSGVLINTETGAEKQFSATFSGSMVAESP